MFIVDAHLDIAYGALEDGRNPLESVRELRAAEPKRPRQGRATVSFPQLREAGVGLIFGTLFVMPKSANHGEATRMVYDDAESAHRIGMAQLDYYRRLVEFEENRLRLVGDLSTLAEVVASHEQDKEPLLGIVPLMEGADPIREPEEVELWFERGVRLIGLAWDDTRYAAGAWRGSRHGLTQEGRALLEVMGDLGLILDVTHMSEKASLEALDQYEGPVVATHSNCRMLVPGERQLSDTQIRAIGEREGVIGTVLFNRFLRPNLKRGSGKQQVTLDHVVAHIDHICQVLGDAQHVGLGTDMDGGFGADDIPAELDTAADLPLIGKRLEESGYGKEDVNRIMGENWLELLRRSWAD